MSYTLKMAVFASDPNAEILRLTPNRIKILEAILVVIEAGERTNRPPTQFDIAKTIFLADYRHLLSYGRPVTYDNFHAMKHGPVPSETYNMLQPSFDWSSLELVKAPWTTTPISANSRHYVRPARSANRSKLSESDIAAIEQAFADVKAMGFSKTSDITHKLEAYKKAWAARGPKKANQMDLRVLLPDFDADMLDNLAFASKYV